MADGIRVEVQVDDPGTCPVVAASRETNRAITTISWSSPNKGDTVIEEFTTASDVSPIDTGRIETVFESDCCARHRFMRQGSDCVCELIEFTGSPIENVRANEGRLTVSFYAYDVDEVSDVVSTLRERFSGVKLQRLHRADGLEDERLDSGDLVWIDRDALTDRQQEVLETAHEMGYFEYPRETNATEVAEAIGIAPSTFSEHLTIAQSKILESMLSG